MKGVAKSTEFWARLDDALTELNRDWSVGVMGPAKFGRACCNTCSMAEIEADDGVFYHEQEYDYGRKKCEAYLGWFYKDRSDLPRIVQAVVERNGLVFDWDGSESTKFIVRLA